MNTIIIDGKKTSKDIKDELIIKVEQLKNKGVEPTLAVVLVGKDPASQVYVKHKKKACEYVGMRSLAYELDEKTTEESLLELINELNNRDDVHGILVQLPLPKHIDEEKILLAIDSSKDVDGFHPYSVGNLSIGRDGFVSCTPAGIIELIKRYNIEIEGKNCVVIGRSNIVGKPVSMLLLKENGTVTICHSRTKNIKEICKNADILVVAIGRANFVTKDFVKEGATVIDVGMNRLDNGKLCGDVKYDECSVIAGAITPVPGGVGPMTIAMLMSNCVKSANNMLK
ncbi:bifunctional methylenetetrahydrofolate dehydrogenase/methenyltetrahydrofolate cyclohydrolase FolD [Vallitalea sp.]|jgi:methylenetetrahydrofolate dehydrogenase (NADP+)/methenyltetrahydrofolate cyclohydrolase|uniref:bifunctional methylenetetrahydrofolate dehydrogenase/methenyltetrahydrofolate cyclohydrolase FolD n=1 Tax=Vallitalea sp. TaxID=1882829 RepID=UPI0025E58E68|nr:bifunctional methylenetetrahydrofolate dehydrogenase/methenyltetrahydrofolate cyclohydrolase FolD [Vallitalea sp.]MCT4687448.1 bifunctional methylenetetrahydrofolate dehydrogenase/methenyltetrahydrofolate cyclohydrolase FolD [Vallitalea sp.]